MEEQVIEGRACRPCEAFRDTEGIQPGLLGLEGAMASVFAVHSGSAIILGSCGVISLH